MKTLKSPPSLNMAKLKSIPTPILFALGYFLFGGLLSVTLGQDMSWDLRNYHFYNPYMLLTGRMHYDILPAQIQTFFNPLMDIPFFVSIHYLKIPSILVGFVLGGIHGLNILLVHYIIYFSLTNVSERYRQMLSFLGAFTSIWGAAYLSELGTSIGDNNTSLCVLGALLIIIYGLSKQQNLKLKYILIAGFVIGLGVGMKLTTALYGIGLLVGLNFVPSSLTEKIRNSVALIGAMFGGFILTAGYWMVLMWKNFSNPLFPFFNTIFKSPYIETDFNLKDLRFLPRNIWQSLFYPFYFLKDPNLVAELKFRDAKLALAYILIVVLIVLWLYAILRRKKLSSEQGIVNYTVFSLLIPFYTASYLIWQTQFSIYRYLIPLELLTPVLVILVIGYLYPVKKQVFYISLSIFFLLIVTVKPLDWWRMSWSNNYFGIDQNALTQYDNSTIVMWGDEPTSYLVPHFPKTARFVRIRGNSGLGENTLMRKNAEKFIQNAPAGSLYFLERDRKDKITEKAQDLKAFNLNIAPGNCYPLLTRIEGENYTLCPLKKL